MLAAAAALLASTVFAGAAPAAPADEPAPVDLKVGESLVVCGRLVACPILSAICDDPKVARVEVGEAGAELRAGEPGTTLCGILGSNGVRRVVRVTVKRPGKR